MATEIVVGVDGSRCSNTALRWAAAEAGRRGAPLRVICAYEWGWLPSRHSSHGTVEAVAREHAEEVLAAAVDEARATAPDLPVTTAAGAGSPAKVLLEAAAGAAMVVVGSRGRGGFASLVVGSTCQQVATHAPALAAVIRGRGSTAAGPVVVGVDGSAPSEHALGVGFEEARARGCGLVAVRAHLIAASPWNPEVPPVPDDGDEAVRAERAALDHSLAPWAEKYPDVPAEAQLAAGPASRALATVSMSAQLVVVGASGHSGLAGALLGSVGMYLLHHADCPVLVTRPSHGTAS